jgi:hypothetical protein
MRFDALWAAVSAAALAGTTGVGRGIELPAKAEALREGGVPAAEVASAIRAAREHGLDTADTADLLESARGARVDDLGAVVRAKLEQGLRGRALALAIRREHARRRSGSADGGS